MTTWRDGTSSSRAASALESAVNTYADVKAGLAGMARRGALVQGRASVTTRPGSPGTLAAAMNVQTPAFLYPMGALDVSTTAYDASANANNGTYTGSPAKGIPTPLDAGDARGVTFYGSSATYITSGTTAAIGATATYEVWIRIRDNDSEQYLISPTSAGPFGVKIYPSGGGFVVRVTSSSDGTTIADSTAVLTDRYRWHHVAVTMNGSTASTHIYLDGVDVTGSITTKTITTATAFKVGNGSIASGVCMSHAALYPSALTATQLQAHIVAARLDYRRAPFTIGFHSDLTYYGAGPDFTGKVATDVALGARVARVTIPWYSIETIQGSPSWTNTDAAINALVAAGIEPIAVLSSSPQWLTSNADQWVVPTGGSLSAWVTAQATWATTVVTRYKDRIGRWEIWNEPNETNFWKPTPSASDYKSLYDAVRAAILAVDPGAVCAVGGLTGLVASGSIAGRTFLASLYGASIVMDAVSLHPYGGDPTTHTNFGQSYDDTLRIVEEMWTAGYSASDVWITEFGWETSGISQATQATYLESALAAHRDYLSRYVSTLCYFLDADTGSYTQGLYTSAYAAKTAAATFRKHAARSS